MYKIGRVNIPDVFFICRCYGSQRNQPNHYETLSVKNNSSQKEIRDAFLKLSKKLHPDIGSKGSHAEFVKLNEAYKILSKDNSRRQHDMDLKYQSATAQNPRGYHYAERVYREDPRDFKFRTYKDNPEFDTNYYGIKGIKRMSNGKVAMICVLVCALIVSLEVTLLRRSVEKNRKYLASRSLQAEQDYNEVRAIANTMTREEQIKAIQKKFDSQNS